MLKIVLDGFIPELFVMLRDDSSMREAVIPMLISYLYMIYNVSPVYYRMIQPMKILRN